MGSLPYYFYNIFVLFCIRIPSRKKATYQIVGDDEADLEANKISISSPIARALIGKEEGDVATFSSPGGSREVEILNVKYI